MSSGDLMGCGCGLERRVNRATTKKGGYEVGFARTEI